MSMVFSLFRTRHYLTKGEKSKYLYFLFFQVILGILDLIAVALIGAVTLLALNGAINFPKMFASIENIVNLTNLKFLAIASLTIFLFKTVLSFILSRLTLNFAKKIQMRIFSFQIKEVGKINFQSSYRLISNYLGQNLTEGINAFSLGIIGYSLLAASEIFLISIIFAPLFVFAPTLTLFTLLVFTLSFYVIHHITSIWSVKSGSQRIKSFEDIRNFVADTLRIAKILRVTDSYTNFTKKIVQSGRKSAEANADVYLIQLIPKYVLEGTIIVGATLLGVYFSFQNDFGKSIGIISIFLAASMRLLPSLLRLQGAILIMKKSFGESEMFFKTMELLNLEFKAPQSNIPTLDDDNLIEYQDISFSYSKSGNLVFSEFSNFIPRNKITVIEGPSGSGKTTLLDLTLGLLEVNTGQIRSRLNSFQIGYMTQDSLIVSGSVAENITLGKDFRSVGGLSPERCLDLVGLQSWIESLPNGLESQISSNSNFMSGGQRQRLGLARALFSSDELLIIDEPTSSLDYDSEDLIFDSLQQLKGTKTIIIVAHSHKPSLFADHKITLA